MDPVCFHIGSRPIYWYGVMMACAFLAGIAHWRWLARREGRDESLAGDLAFWIVLGGLAGARAAYVAANWSYFRLVPAEIIRMDQGGLVYYGGFIGAAAVIVAIALIRRLKMLDLGDFVITALPLGHALGRIGCFLNGCCYGKTTASVFGFVYPGGADSAVWRTQVKAGLVKASDPHCLPVYPVQLFEAAFNLALYVLLTVFYLRWRRGRQGLVVAAYLLLYPLGRFTLETLRGDERLALGPLNAAQGLSLALFLTGAILWFALSRRHEDAPRAG